MCTHRHIHAHIHTHVNTLSVNRITNNCSYSNYIYIYIYEYRFLLATMHKSYFSIIHFLHIFYLKNEERYDENLMKIKVEEEKEEKN